MATSKHQAFSGDSAGNGPREDAPRVRLRGAWTVRRLAPALVLLALGATACGPDGGRAGAPLPVTPALALGLPDNAVEAPTTNPGSDAKVALGRDLFWDPILSGDRDVACASCHHPALGYADGRRTAIGTGGFGLGPRRTIAAGLPTPNRNSMTVLDAAFNGLTLDGPAGALGAPMFWDNRVRSLEAQALGPLKADREMRGTAYDEARILPELVARLAAIPAYVTQFEGSFGPGGITADRVAGAIAAFERSIVATDSSFDRYMRGDATAMSPRQLRGMAVFQSAGCGGCHSGPMFSDFELHPLGVPDLPGAAHDPGDGRNRFRTASLRFATRTAPYMHNGVFATLDDVYEFYRRADDRSPDPALRGVRAPRGDDAAAVTAFLGALSDGSYDTTIPASVPSGLPVGGLIR